MKNSENRKMEFDNTLMQDLMGLSRIQEIGAGTRQIQQYIMSYGLRKIFKML